MAFLLTEDKRIGLEHMLYTIGKVKSNRFSMLFQGVLESGTYLSNETIWLNIFRYLTLGYRGSIKGITAEYPMTPYRLCELFDKDDISIIDLRKLSNTRLESIIKEFRELARDESRRRYNK